MVTYVDDRFPIFWERATGALVEDVDGNSFLDLSAAFGVANVGHTHPRVVEALKRQADRLLHGMGDVHPAAVKVALAKRLADLTPGDLRQIIFTGSGSEAVEAALKTAARATGRSGVIAFQGAYHGLGYGALEATARRAFREPVEGQRGRFVLHAPYPYHYRCPFQGQHRGSCEEACLAYLERLLDDPASGVPPIGAVLVEPMQGRGGVVIPDPSFLRGLRRVCTKHRILLIADEIFTGFGRTGRWFGVDHSGIVPDLLCLGKALAGGFPLSACLGNPEVMGQWGNSTGEALHTSTFLGNPLGCAMALATLEVLEEEALTTRAAELGRWLTHRLEAWPKRFPQVGDIRGVGLMVGIELATDPETRTPHPQLAWALVQEALQAGVIVLSGGAARNVLTLSPPLTITRDQLAFAITQLERCLTHGVPA